MESEGKYMERRERNISMLVSGFLFLLLFKRGTFKSFFSFLALNCTFWPGRLYFLGDLGLVHEFLLRFKESICRNF